MPGHFVGWRHKCEQSGQNQAKVKNTLAGRRFGGIAGGVNGDTLAAAATDDDDGETAA